MKAVNRGSFPILIVSGEIGSQTLEGRRVRAIAEKLEGSGFNVLKAHNCTDGLGDFHTHPNLGCAVVDWNTETDKPQDFLRGIRRFSDVLPVLLMTDRFSVEGLPIGILREIDGYIWLAEDTPDFIAGRIEKAALSYIEGILPVFFRELVKYAEEYRYSWHTPGHMGGVAFMKTPAGKVCFDFFGENMFRADLSVSVPELGSLPDHQGPIGAAERHAARVFNASQTFFVTNGSSASNLMVWNAMVASGDVVVVDRNCHKSINHAIILTDAVPVYFMPTRNPYGTIGPISLHEFDADAIRAKIADSPLITDKNARVRLAAITNSTYDGLCYNTMKITDALSDIVDGIHFDEAWFAYAHFHPLYRGHYAMTPRAGEPDARMPVFATQSTHKTLAAMSQASMVHYRDGADRKIDPDVFNEAYLMHSSTSPQYGMIATLDVSTQMMEGKAGVRMMQEALREPVVFRKTMASINSEIMHSESDPARKWWFTAWQPDGLLDVEDRNLLAEQDWWILKSSDSWHMFKGMDDGGIMLDPFKVTIATPGITREGTLDQWGIPAAIVTKWLRSRGIMVEKTGHYSWLLLFSIGITKGKSGTLLAELFRFKELYDEDVQLEEILPNLVKSYPDEYGDMTIQQLCNRMHGFLREYRLVEGMLGCFSTLPRQVMTPSLAYRGMVRGNVEKVGIRSLENRVSAVQVVPYPPGIPIIMPGEMITEETRHIIDYLAAVEELEVMFPGFEGEIHGVHKVRDDEGVNRFHIYCLNN
jgi:lysine decarboxylase/arginine decarboxylase